MGQAREEFLERLASFSTTLTERYVVDQGPTQVQHNAQARLIRNGLAVMGFTILEDFLRRRTSEATTFLAGVNVDFDDLPERMRKALTRGAIAATIQIERNAFDNQTDRIRFVQDEAKVIGSSDQPVRAFSQYAFGWESSNLGADQLAGALKAFGIDKPWVSLGNFMRRAGFGTPDAESEFRNAAKRRHSAAHDANANVQPSELQSFSLSATGIGLAFDALVSESLRRFRLHDSGFITQQRKVVDSDLRVRYITPVQNRHWAEYRDHAKRATKRYRDLATAVASAHTRAIRNSEILLITDARGIIVDWRTHEQ